MYEKICDWMKEHKGEVSIGAYAAGSIGLTALAMKWLVKATTKAVTNGINASNVCK